VLSCADYRDLAEAAAAYFADIQQIARPMRAAVAIAGPVSSDQITLTNNAWSFSVEQTRRTLGFEALSVLNDYTAVAYILPKLREQDVFAVGPRNATGWAASRTGALGIVAPGTGLGIGGLISDAAGGVPVTSEGGHAGFAPADDVEIEIVARLMKRFGHVSNERLLSGAGLVHLYEIFCDMRGREPQSLEAKDVTTRALDGSDPLCRDALERFCMVLGSVAGDLALTLRADTIFIGGGIVPRFTKFLAESRFRERFEHKGRFAPVMRRIGTSVITAEHPGLMGAAAYLALRATGEVCHAA
jgi:glucokinase